uniref:Putative secreted peptide n=1 Tax=Anopheles braziliensis TaxID=58242 RepID=A0A2M3ZPU5_9DIPT
MFVLLWHLLLDLRFQPAEQEWSQYLVKALNDRIIVLGVAFNHARHRIREPLLELAVRLKDVRHQEVHQ